jgi:hypothetical protein
MLFLLQKAFAAWTKLMSELKAQKEVDLIISISDLKKLQKRSSQTFELVPFVDQSQTVNKAYLDTIKKICSKTCLLRRFTFQ